MALTNGNYINGNGNDDEQKYRPLTSLQSLEVFPQFERVSTEQRFEMQVVSSVLPFRVNAYIINDLIDWDAVPEDPIFQLTFPQRGMLSEKHFRRMAALHRRGADRKEIQDVAKQIRSELNPHPAGQRELNVPTLGAEPMPGLQHKYAETVLFFPSQGQTCHAYCTFCFRWAQFVGDSELRFADSNSDRLHRYLAEHTEVTDLLVTGGDPMVMKSRILGSYLEPLLAPEFDHIQDIRIGSKALTFWPQRFLTDPEADETLRLFERLVEGGKHVAFMAHLEHEREISTGVAREAIRRIRSTGAVIRSQAPLLAHVNDSAEIWTRMWRQQVHLGIVPYYMFVERDTGARHYFEVPLARAWKIYRNAIKQVSGPGAHRPRSVDERRTGQGRSPGRWRGSTARRFSCCNFIQARNPEWCQIPFFARFNPRATWLDDLEPAFGEDRFFFEDEYDEICATGGLELLDSDILEDRSERSRPRPLFRFDRIR